MYKERKNKLKFLSGLLFCIILFSLASSEICLAKSDGRQENWNISVVIPPIPEGLIPHEVIEIINDANFTDYGFPGSGTEEDPYLIQNYNITSDEFGTPGILIDDVKKYFTIQNCFVQTMGDGITIKRVNKGACDVINNYIYESTGYGLEIRFGYNLLVERNTIVRAMYGIYLDTADGSVIMENLCYQNTIKGISLYQTNDCTIVNNTLAESTEGISLGTASDCTVANNTCANNLEYGIKLFDAQNNNLMYNTLVNNTEYGIYLRNIASKNKIHHNAFIDNNLLGTSQAEDEGSSNTWYDNESNEGNYWDDWSGIGSYQIGGPATSEDLYPLDAIPVFTGLGEVEEILDSSFSSSIYIVLAIGVLALSLRFRKKRKN